MVFGSLGRAVDEMGARSGGGCVRAEIAGERRAMSARWVLPVAFTLLSACAARTAAPVAAGQSTAPGEMEPPPGVAPAGTPGSSGVASAVVPSAPLPGGEEPTPDKALPELRVEVLGMHIGGGTNSPEEKAPFHRALEQKFPAFLECYRAVDDPWAGGSFGVDIKVARAGGAPTVEQPRTRIRGAAFRDCMLAAFGKAQFEKPKAGPTVLSYSVLFTLGKAKR
jgi:hypothetical protein